MSSCIIFDFQYNIAAVLIYIYTRDGLPWVCTFQYLLYFWLNEVDQSISGVFNGTNQPEKMIPKERQDPAIDFYKQFIVRAGD